MLSLIKNYFLLLFLYQGLALLALRVVIGIIFLAHGLPKKRNQSQTVENFEKMGFKPGKFWATFIIWLEIIGGSALVVGAFTQLVSFLFAIEMLVVIFKVKRGMKLAGGYELDLILCVACLLLMTTGAGSLSIDRLFLGL